MKESGIDWIGQIPEEWEVTKLKYALLISNGKDYKDIEVEEGGYPVIGSGGVFARSRNYMYDGDVVLLGRKGTIDKPLFYSGKFWTVDTMFYSTALNGNNIKFMYYSSLLIPFSYYSTATALPSMTQSDLNNHMLCLPSISEQTKIADFLDKKTAQLDKAKSLLEEQIQKLKDYRASLIYETVTKGLDKNVPMKDSGIDWIGQVPQGWGVSRLKYYFDIYAGGDIDERNTVEEYSESHPYPVLSNSLENEGVLGYTNKYRFKKNCVTVTGRGDVGKAVYRNINFYPVVRLLVCVPKSQVDCRFVTYWINSAIIEKNQTAVSQLTIQMLGELLFVNVPFLVQKNIADFLDKETIQIDKLIQIKNQQIDNINKQRQTLIYDYVTGKRRV